jgi:hypothetical protein
MRVTGLGLGADRDDGAGALRQLAMTGYEVRMEVGLEDPADLQCVRDRLVEVHLDVARRIHDDGLAAVTDQVGGVARQPT